MECCMNASPKYGWWENIWKLPLTWFRRNCWGHWLLWWQCWQSNHFQHASEASTSNIAQTSYPSGPSKKNPPGWSIVGGTVIDNVTCVAWGSHSDEPLNPEVENDCLGALALIMRKLRKSHTILALLCSASKALSNIWSSRSPPHLMDGREWIQNWYPSSKRTNGRLFLGIFLRRKVIGRSLGRRETESSVSERERTTNIYLGRRETDYGIS